MTHVEPRITCPLCGAGWDEAAGRACAATCGLGSGCGLLRCPACGYETPAPTAFTRWLRRWIGGAEDEA